MKLSDFFSVGHIVNSDTVIKVTHYANSAHQFTVTFAESEYYLKKALDNPNVTAVITTTELASLVNTTKSIVVSNKPKEDFFKLHNFMFEKGCFDLIAMRSICSSAIIANTAIIKGNVIIEEGVVIEDYAVIESNSHLKKNSYIGSHAVIGARGMHNTFIDGGYIWVKDAGGVVVGCDVQVLPHATIQKSYFYEQTTIGLRSIISVHCNIGHGSKVGQNTMIAGNAQLAGYTCVGNDAWIGPSVTTAHGITIGDKAEVMLGSVVVNNIPSAVKVSGNFAMSHRKNLRKFAKESR